MAKPYNPDRMTISQELQLFIGYSYRDMEELYRDGRINWRLWRHYKFLWTWGTNHFWNLEQSRFYDRHGSAKYWGKIERVKRLIEYIKTVPIPPSEHIPFRVGALNP